MYTLTMHNWEYLAILNLNVQILSGIIFFRTPFMLNVQENKIYKQIFIFHAFC